MVFLDSRNTNFGDFLRKRTKNIFFSLKTNVYRVGYAAYILHYAMQSNVDVLLVNVKIIVSKKFKFFHINTDRDEHLKEF